MFCSFNFYGKVVHLKVSNPTAFLEIKRFWKAFQSQQKNKSPDVIFEILKFPQTYFSLFKPQYFYTDQFIFLLDRHTLVTCHFDQIPWRIYVQYFDHHNNERQSGQLVYGVFGLLLRAVLKRFGYFQLHSAAVSNRKYGILIPGRTGSGKTTTALMMLQENFKLVADDQVFLKKENSSVQALGFARDLSLTRESISFFPKLSFLNHQPSIRKGRRFKKTMSPKQLLHLFPDQATQKTKINYIFFPCFSKHAKTKIQRISKLNALARLLNVESQERYRLLIKDDFSLKSELEIFSELCEKAKSYDLLISKKDRNVSHYILDAIAAGASY